MTRSVIDPITRIEGHLRVEMEVTNGKVSDAWVSGGCFRGMEMVVENRTPEDAAQIVQRICGVCPVSHAHSSAIAAEKAYGIKISNNARIIRNLLEGAQFLHSHILWFYNLAALDYVNPLNALQAISQMCELAVVKIGTKGALIKQGEEVVHVGIMAAAKRVDTTGAGDFYAAGFLAGLCDGLSLRQCGTIGAITAGKVIEVVGTTFGEEAWADIHRLVNKVKNEKYLF